MPTCIVERLISCYTSNLDGKLPIHCAYQSCCRATKRVLYTNGRTFGSKISKKSIIVHFIVPGSHVTKASKYTKESIDIYGVGQSATLCVFPRKSMEYSVLILK